jgi:hypothetical protein
MGAPLGFRNGRRRAALRVRGNVTAIRGADGIWRIPLTNGGFALIDQEDVAVAIPHIWKRHTDGSVVSKINGKTVRLHRLILSAPRGVEVDHINFDRLDDQRSNIRLCTGHENRMHLRIRGVPKTSRYKGVYWIKRLGRWRASITVNYKWIDLGLFDSEDTAARAYNAAAIKHFSVFAEINRGVESEGTAI